VVLLAEYFEVISFMSLSAKPATATFGPRDWINLVPIKYSVGIGFALLLVVAAYFSPHIWEHGEAREALVVQDIVNNDRWILPVRNGELPSKPVLYHWIATSFAMLIGPSDFTMRLPSLLGAALMLWVTCSLGALDNKATAGLLAAGILGSTFEFWDSGTEARVDMLFAALVGLSLAGWYLWYRSGAEFARATAYLAVALAVLTKGPAGAVLPAIVIVSFVAVERDFAKLFAFFSWRWIFVVLLVDVGWYVAAYQRGGTEFWNKQIVYENFQRFVGTGKFETQKGNLSQGVWLVTQLLPWSIVLLLSLIQWLRGHRKEPIDRFLHVWWLGIFLFFLVASGQRSVYLLPIYPAVALLTARELKTWIAAGHTQLTGPVRFDRNLAGAVFFMLFNVSIALAVPISRTVREDSSSQEEFVYDVMEIVPPTAKLYAAPDFPETTLLVLAYRLERNIRRQTPDCEEDYYYLTGGSRPPSCSPSSPPALLAERKKALYLLRNTPAEIPSRTKFK
jgi:4-amino-4-deoxy-L-arabinose transferase-like glycosyltransferase